MARRMRSPFHVASEIGTAIVAAAQKPWRTVRRTSRTAWRLRPSSSAARGEVAETSPIAKIRKAKYRFVPRAPAASACGPIQPIRMTSDVMRALWATFVRTSGQLRAIVARNSAAQGLRSRFRCRDMSMRALVAESAADRHPLALETRGPDQDSSPRADGVRKGFGARHPERRIEGRRGARCGELDPLEAVHPGTGKDP